MDHELLSLFPSETEPPVDREQVRAAAASSGNGTKARLRPAIDTIQALEQNVQFLKARSHVAHALSEGYRNTRFVNADEATSSHVRHAGRVRPTPTQGAMAALLVAAMLLAFAGARFLPAADHTPVKQAELLPALTAPAWKIAESAVAQRISPPEVGVRTAQATSEPAVAQRISPPEVSARTAQATSINTSTQKVLFKGHLVVDSVPTGATVLINQRPAGTTPLRVTDYPAGSYAVWVEREGYERWTAGVLVQADKTTRIRPVLLSKPDRQSANIE
jgi:hypothetical protein